jgi:hypothetical protein
LTIALAADLLVQAEFEVVQGAVKEFKVVLNRLEEDGEVQWLVRYETHGGTAHKHERWDDAGKSRHTRPKEWKGSNADLVTAAIQDLKARFEEYERRYEAWKQSASA